MFLSRDDILKADDLPREAVDVPEWGGTVLVRVLTGTERDRFETSCADDEWGTRNYRARLCSLCMVDEKGRPLFSFEEAELLGRKSSQALKRVFDVAVRINGMSREELEELEKNSGTGRNGASISGSASLSENAIPTNCLLASTADS